MAPYRAALLNIRYSVYARMRSVAMPSEPATMMRMSMRQASFAPAGNYGASSYSFILRQRVTVLMLSASAVCVLFPLYRSSAGRWTSPASVEMSMAGSIGLMRKGLEPRMNGPRTTVVVGVRAQGDGRESLSVHFRANPMNERESVFVRHRHVAEEHVRAGARNGFKGFMRGSDGGQPRAILFEDCDHRFSRIWFVVDKQHTQAGQP
jgi:hypothetical protein